MTSTGRKTSQDTSLILAGSGVGTDQDGRRALSQALQAALPPLGGEAPDLLLLFASDAFHSDHPALLSEAAERSAAREIAGCTGGGVIGFDRELEVEPAVAALALRFPTGSFVNVRHLVQDELPGLQAPGSWPSLLGLRPGGCTGLILLADPFTVDVEALIKGLARDYPDVPIVGGLAATAPASRHTHVFSGSQAFEEGAVVIGLSGGVALRAVVSQGCEPIGEPWTVTEAHGHVVRTIGNKPAYEVLVGTLRALDEPERMRVSRNLLVGLAMDEYREEFRRGDFLIRNLMGADRDSGAMAIGAHPHVGQTLQFQVRDARAADEELRHLVAEAAQELEQSPSAALLFACNGRGSGLFGQPDHDVRVVRELLGAPPVAGFFCNGEIGPVGRGTYLHGFTASLGLFVPNPSDS